MFVLPVGLGEKSGDLGDGVGRSLVAEVHVLPVLWVSGPQRLPLGGLARRLALLIDTQAGSKLSNLGPRPEKPCQQTRVCQRRKWRILGVERGQRGEPWRLRTQAEKVGFELENGRKVQIQANVGDTNGGRGGEVSTKTGSKKYVFKNLAPQPGFEPRFTASKAAVLPLDDRGAINPDN